MLRKISQRQFLIWIIIHNVLCLNIKSFQNKFLIKNYIMNLLILLLVVSTSSYTVRGNKAFKNEVKQSFGSASLSFYKQVKSEKGVDS